jgi:hypothetical protein
MPNSHFPIKAGDISFRVNRSIPFKAALQLCSKTGVPNNVGRDGLILKTYLMYDHMPASLYRRMIVETDGKKYRLRISEGEVNYGHPYQHLEKNRHSKLYGKASEAKEAAESLFRKFESVGWLLGDSERDK